MTLAPPDPPRVDILLATFNGARFIDEQIESLFHQTYPHWRVLARDDNSNDNTVRILSQYAERHPERFVLIADGDGNLGYVGNFSRLMEVSNANYLAFCDQDDVWLPDKLALGMQEMHGLEQAYGKSMPLLVHGNLRVVDRELGEICPSFWDYQGLDPTISDNFNWLLVQNVVTGCATLLNRPLRELSLPIPAEAKAHDWWIALVAAAFGTVGYVTEPAVLYRQHGRNTIGANADGRERYLRRVLRFLRNMSESREKFTKTFAQAAAFWNRHGEFLSSRHAAMLQGFLAAPGTGTLRRLYFCRKWRVLPWFGFEVAFAILTHGMEPHQTGAPISSRPIR